MTNDEKEIQEKWAEKNPSGDKETTVEKMFGCRKQEKAIDEAWAKLRAPVNETVNSKWYFKKGFEAGQKSHFPKIIVDPDMPKNEIELRGEHNSVRIKNIGEDEK